jgi:hypothetical protein
MNAPRWTRHVSTHEGNESVQYRWEGLVPFMPIPVVSVTRQGIQIRGHWPPLTSGGPVDDFNVFLSVLRRAHGDYIEILARRPVAPEEDEAIPRAVRSHFPNLTPEKLRDRERKEDRRRDR